MIYVLLNNEKSVLQDKIVDFIKINLKYNNYKYKFIFNNQHIIEADLKSIDELNDVVLWNPVLAHNNLEIVKQFTKSIVILEKPTILTQKVSKLNPINESTAIFNGFYLIYIEPENNDITNEEYSLIVHETNYLYDLDSFFKLLNSDNTNQHNNQNNKLIVSDESDFIQQQINIK